MILSYCNFLDSGPKGEIPQTLDVHSILGGLDVGLASARSVLNFAVAEIVLD
jgi:hypothetical protein